MIIFGMRGVTTTPDKGTFVCPECGKSNYKLKRVRRFFTLYFIPVIPLNKLGEYVECQSCSNTFNERALEWNPEENQRALEAEYSIACKRVMLKTALADGEVDENEIDEITRLFSDIANLQVDRGDIAAELEAAKADKRTVREYVKSLVGSLNEHGKERVLTAALKVAISDGIFAKEEKALIQDLGEALQMSKAHVGGVLYQNSVTV